VTKIDEPDPVEIGARLAYTITVTDKGPDAATNVRLSDPLPGSTVLLAVTASQGTCSEGPILTCSLGTIQKGQLVTVVVVVRPTSIGTIENTATAVGTEPEANPADNTATAVTTVVGPAHPPRPPKPPTHPKPPNVCVAFRVHPFVVLAGRSTTLRVVVTVGRRPGKAVRVGVHGVGVHAVVRTGSTGVARFRVRPRRTGFLTVSLPGRRTCAGPRRVGVVAPILRPPVTG
jgi:uncharacterized repeat protein (TIGR01451 family)